MSDKLQIHGLTQKQLVKEARARIERGHGVANDVYKQVMREGRFAPEDFGLRPSSVDAWTRNFAFDLPEVAQVAAEPGEFGQTAKAVLKNAEGLEYECVRIPMGDRYSLCVSSQVGCKMGCTFCETGRMGLLRNLTPAEIMAQVLVAQHRLGWGIRNIVFMGMGEPLDNVDGVIQVIEILSDPAGYALAQERLTVCTVGKVDGIKKLAERDYRRVNLSVSLNAARDDLRSAIMPVNRKTPLADLREALADYRPRRNFALGVNYCLMPDLNDTREDARLVAEFCEPLGRVLLNLIPYNPGNDPISREPSEEEVERFIGWLRDEGLPVRRRLTKGRSVMAACGQLGNAGLRKALRDKKRTLTTIE